MKVKCGRKRVSCSMRYVLPQTGNTCRQSCVDAVNKSQKGPSCCVFEVKLHVVTEVAVETEERGEDRSNNAVKIRRIV